MAGRYRMGAACLFLLLSLSLSGMPAECTAASESGDIRRQYEDYAERFEAIQTVEDVEEGGYRILEKQVFPVAFETFGGGELTLLPTLEKDLGRLAFFLADSDGEIVWRTRDLEANNCIRGSLKQPVKELASLSFVDVNGDQRTDIVLLARCQNAEGDYTGASYKVGDVLFQGDGTFYRDWRISDKINRFSMNKSAGCMISYVRDGQSAEYLYTAKTMEELLGQGFSVIEEQCYTRDFEKLGRLRVVPGTASISDYHIFMIYLIDGQGNIVWSFQPMDDYDSLYALMGIHGRDLDGDGLRDLVALGRYSLEGPDGETLVESGCAIYYQRTGGFERDTEFEKVYRCTEEDTMEELVRKIREYWGWQVEP